MPIPIHTHTPRLLKQWFPNCWVTTHQTPDVLLLAPLRGREWGKAAAQSPGSHCCWGCLHLPALSVGFLGSPLQSSPCLQTCEKAKKRGGGLPVFVMPFSGSVLCFALLSHQETPVLEAHKYKPSLPS